ncbi:uncharacterized protein LOC117341025 isoform X3 [Pecten maximus]|nr:uncharacterized protein LOC117341025 isoform X3 [Pecten maximus]
MPPKRKAATNHSTIPPRSRTTVTTEVVNAGENQFLPVQPGIQRPATEETPGRLIPESEVEAIVQRAVKQGVETACRQFFPHLNDMTAVMPATSRPPSSQDGATASTALPQVNEAVGREVQKIMSLSLPRANASTVSIGPGTLPTTLTKLLGACLAPSTERTYNKVLSDLDKFCLSVLHTHARLPLNYATVALYIAHCHEKGLSASTICSHLSAIAYVHNISGLADPTKSFSIKKILTGASKTAPTYDTRLPITEPILHKLVSSLTCLCPDLYDQQLYRSIFTLAFYGLARIGELVYTNSVTAKNVLQISDLRIAYRGGIPYSIEISFSNFKHNSANQIHNVTVSSLEKDSIVCPVKALLGYLSVRGSSSGSLYIHKDKRPVIRNSFDSMIRRCLRFCELDSSLYKGHSFRIGGASLAAERGMTDAQIRLLGRWKSDAFKKYIRAAPLYSA